MKFSIMCPRLALLIFLQLISFGRTFLDKQLDEEHRTVPGWHHYQYRTSKYEDFILFREYVLSEASPRSFLLCPENYSIAQVAYALILNRNLTNKNPQLLEKTIPFVHHYTEMQLPFCFGDRFIPEGQAQEMCPTLKECLLRQACVFDFGNEFCRQDPLPKRRKLMDTNITCVRDSNMEQFLSNEGRSLEEFRAKRRTVLQIKYDSKLDDGIEARVARMISVFTTKVISLLSIWQLRNKDLEDTQFTFLERQEEKVFGAFCSINPYQHCYRGNCSFPLNYVNVAQRTWHLMARTSSSHCQELLKQTFCAYMYNPKGFCVPPYTLENSPENTSLEMLTFNNYSFPIRERRDHDTNILKNIQADPKASLIPARIAFLILVHKDCSSILQLLEHIYQPQHFYVIHIDRQSSTLRSELTLQLNRRFGINVRVIPQHRSFVTSWGSFGIVRGQLEGFEELCRMGLWDFVITLSGSDLPLRNMEDLAFALAPYRGLSFLAFHKLKPRNVDPKTASSLLLQDSYLGCDGFNFNVTRIAPPPSVDEIAIRTSSQWSVLSREFVEEYLDQDRHNERWKRFYFYLQSSVIPDETILSTFAVNSGQKYHVRHIGLHLLKTFSRVNTYNLCRHLQATDVCGQGPNLLDASDAEESLPASGHRYFFARKFPTRNASDPVRAKALDLAKRRYYRFVQAHLPTAILQHLARNATFEFVRRENFGRSFAKPFISIQDVHIFPKLHPRDPCCSYLFDRHFRSVQEFSYIIDFRVSEESRADSEQVELRSKFDLVPQGLCFGSQGCHL